MGPTYSFLNDEKLTWMEHVVKHDACTRAANLKLLEHFRDDSEIYLSCINSCWGSVEFQHWFITDRVHFLEFGSVNLNIYSARVTINTNVRQGYSLDVHQRMNKAMRERMSHVVGMCNYSLFLRNCEHVANYVFHGRWVSDQTNEATGPFTGLRKLLLGDNGRRINSLPAFTPSIAYDSPKKVYTFLEDNRFTAAGIDYYLDNNVTYNALVFGPTGAGKSQFINVFFNEVVCGTRASLQSVTKDIAFVRGRGQIKDARDHRPKEMNLVMVDTVGLCDTVLEDEAVLRLIKQRVSSSVKFIDTVFIVFRADRLLRQYVMNVKALLSWLEYNGHSEKFWFVVTCSENLDEQEKNDLQKQAEAMFGLDRKNSSRHFIFSSFVPEERMSELGKVEVLETRQRIHECLVKPTSDYQRIAVNPTLLHRFCGLVHKVF